MSYFIIWQKQKTKLHRLLRNVCYNSSGLRASLDMAEDVQSISASSSNNKPMTSEIMSVL